MSLVPALRGGLTSVPSGSGASVDGAGGRVEFVTVSGAVSVVPGLDDAGAAGLVVGIGGRTAPFSGNGD